MSEAIKLPVHPNGNPCASLRPYDGKPGEPFGAGVVDASGRWVAYCIGTAEACEIAAALNAPPRPRVSLERAAEAGRSVMRSTAAATDDSTPLDDPFLDRFAQAIARAVLAAAGVEVEG